MFKKEANKMTIQVYICMCCCEPENAHIERLKTLVPVRCKAVLMECTVSSTHYKNRSWWRNIVSFGLF